MIFSPITAVKLVISSPIVEPAIGAFKASSTLAGFAARIAFVTSSTNLMNLSFDETKSVSELISTNAAVLPENAYSAKPSAAIRPLFLAAFATPFSLKISIAFSTSPSA